MDMQITRVSEVTISGEDSVNGLFWMEIKIKFAGKSLVLLVSPDEHDKIQFKNLITNKQWCEL